MKALVTGATGFLGGALVRQLLAEGTDVCCLVRDGRSAEGLTRTNRLQRPGQLTFVTGTLGDADGCRRACDGCELVFHVAASLRGSPAVLFLNNVIGTEQLVKAASASKVRRLVLVSSLAVYGTGHLRANDILDESCPVETNPHLRDGYCYSKVAQEEVAWNAYRSGAIPLVVVRPGVLYGPGRDCLTNRIGLRLGRILFMMGGRQPLPYTFVDNCARAAFLAGTVGGIEGETFNIVDDSLPRASEFVRSYQSHGGPARVIRIPRFAIPMLSGLCEAYHWWSRGQLPAVLTRYKSNAQWKPLRYANSKAKAVLGWSPRIDFANGIQQTVESLCRQKPDSDQSRP